LNLRVGKLIFILALSAAWSRAQADAENPDQVHPSTGTVVKLRAVATDVADTFGGYLDKGHEWLYRRIQYFIEDLDHVYPFAKVYVETGSGLRVSGGVALERWSGRWVLRSASFGDWVRDSAATDWIQTFIAGYARAVIQ